MAIYAHILSIFMLIVVLIWLYKKDTKLFFLLLFNLGVLLLLSLLLMIFPSDKFDAITCIIFGCVLFVCCIIQRKIKGYTIFIVITSILLIFVGIVLW